MNCCWWIILLFVCRGNLGCSSNWSGSRRSRCEMQDCDCDMRNERRSEDCDRMNERRSDDRDRMREGRNEERENRRENRRDDSDCDCNRCGEEVDRSFRENRMSYETFGCQENGVPCPPPVPTSYMR